MPSLTLLLLTATVASSLLGAATAILLLRATVMRRVAAHVQATVKATAEATLKQAGDLVARDLAAAQEAVAALRSERGRVMALLRHRGRVDDDEDDDEDDGQPDRLDRLLQNPVAQGFLQAKGIDPAMVGALADGDPTALLAVQQLAARGSAQPAPQADGLGLLG